MTARKPLKRSPLRPSLEPIPRYAELPRATKKIRARKADPSKRRFAKHRCDPFRESLKTERCCVTGLRTGQWCPQGHNRLLGSPTLASEPIRVLVDPAHTRPRSLGSNDLYECLPLARHLHEEQERIGWPRFERKYGIDRVALAKEYADRWLATSDGLAWLAEHPEVVA